MIHTLILCGGSGSRLWPLSTDETPKQFLNLFNDKSLLVNTFDRVKDLGKVSLVSNRKFLNKINEQLNGYEYNVIIEPVRKDTAPAITSSVAMCGEDSIILVIPSDHYIPNTEDFIKTIKKGIELAEKNYIVTYGVKPTYPETGYGYVELEDNTVKRFTEKPTLEKAVSFLKKGNYYWNAGIFILKKSTFESEMKKHNPVMFDICVKSTRGQVIEKGNVYELSKEFEQVQKISIDFSLLEKTDKIKMVPAHFEWSDVGNWKSIHKLTDLDQDNNTTNIIGDSKNCYYKGSKKIVCIGLNNICIIETANELLIMNMDCSSTLKTVYNKYLKDDDEENLKNNE